MRVMKRLLALGVWVVATVLTLVAVILCVTLVLLPLGLPLMGAALRMYGYGVKLMLPRLPSGSDVADSASRSWRHLRKKSGKSAPAKKTRRAMRQARRAAPAKKTRRGPHKARKQLTASRPSGSGCYLREPLTRELPVPWLVRPGTAGQRPGRVEPRELRRVVHQPLMLGGVVDLDATAEVHGEPPAVVAGAGHGGVAGGHRRVERDLPVVAAVRRRDAQGVTERIGERLAHPVERRGYAGLQHHSRRTPQRAERAHRQLAVGVAGDAAAVAGRDRATLRLVAGGRGGLRSADRFRSRLGDRDLVGEPAGAGVRTGGGRAGAREQRLLLRHQVVLPRDEPVGGRLDDLGDVLRGGGTCGRGGRGLLGAYLRCLGDAKVVDDGGLALADLADHVDAVEERLRVACLDQRQRGAECAATGDGAVGPGGHLTQGAARLVGLGLRLGQRRLRGVAVGRRLVSGEAGPLELLECFVGCRVEDLQPLAQARHLLGLPLRLRVESGGAPLLAGGLLGAWLRGR